MNITNRIVSKMQLPRDSRSRFHGTLHKIKSAAKSTRLDRIPLSSVLQHKTVRRFRGHPDDVVAELVQLIIGSSRSRRQGTNQAVYSTAPALTMRWQTDIDSIRRRLKNYSQLETIPFFLFFLLLLSPIHRRYLLLSLCSSYHRVLPSFVLAVVGAPLYIRRNFPRTL